MNNNVLLPESVSDHMYRMGILSFLVDDEKIDKTRAMKVCRTTVRRCRRAEGVRKERTRESKGRGEGKGKEE